MLYDIIGYFCFFSGAIFAPGSGRCSVHCPILEEVLGRQETKMTYFQYWSDRSDMGAGVEALQVKRISQKTQHNCTTQDTTKEEHSHGTLHEYMASCVHLLQCFKLILKGLAMGIALIISHTGVRKYPIYSWVLLLKKSHATIYSNGSKAHGSLEQGMWCHDTLTKCVTIPTVFFKYLWEIFV